MKKGFTIFIDSLDILDELKDEEAGQLFRAIRDFQRGKDVSLERTLNIAFIPFKNQFIREGMGKNPQEISRINSENRKKRKITKCNEKKENNEINESVHISDSDSISDSISKSISDVISYLNTTCATKFSSKGHLSVKHISARLNEGHTLENFKTVIDKKSLQWLNTEQAKYLRPETLFGNKFEGYLNEIIIIPQQKKSVYDGLSDTKPPQSR